MKLIDKIKLSNSLELQLLDRSRVIAGDRWLVSLEAKIEIDVDKRYLSGVEEADKIVSILKKYYGNKVSYSYVQEKHFVDEKEKEDVMKGFISNVKKTLNYLSHPEFAKKTLLAKYRDLKKKAPWLFQQ